MGMGLGTLGSRFGRLGNAPSKGVGGAFVLRFNGLALTFNSQTLTFTRSS